MYSDAEINEIFEKVALQEGVSTETMRAEIALAIQESMKTTDPVAQEHWRSMQKGGKMPTPEDVFRYLMQLIADA